MLGGGSSINAEIYTRGCPEDYDNWATDHGCDGWSAKDLQAYFVKSEGNTRLGGADHGIDGPLGVSDLRSPNRVSMAYVQGCMDFGMPYNPDFNSGKQEGAGLYQTTTLNGRRCSAAVGYLKPVLKRPNLTLRTDVFVNRIIIENGRARGIEIIENGVAKRIDASTEVIITAGAIGSPKLLMLSGIGPAAHLKEVGVPVVHDLPGVGQNFHDHFSTDVTWVLNGAHSYDKYKKKHWQLWAGLRIHDVQVGAGLLQHRRGRRLLVGRPQLRRHPTCSSISSPVPASRKGLARVPGGNGATCNSYHVRPRSRGHVKLRSSNPLDAPIIDPNSFAEPYDLERHIEGIKITQEVGHTRSMQKFVAAEHFPGPGVKTKQDYIDIARANARSSYHPVGTCKMGRDAMAVIDPHAARSRHRILARLRQFHHAGGRILQYQRPHHCHCRKGRGHHPRQQVIQCRRS